MLSQKKIQWLELSDARDRSVIISPALGGRILGIFLGGANFFWVNENLPCDWNCGGHRTWIAPEWQDKSVYLKLDRCSWFVDPRMDPGNYSVRHFEQKAMVEVAGDLDIVSVDGTHYLLTLTRQISLEPSVQTQRRYHSYAPDGGKAKSICISFEHSLKNRGARPLHQELGLWSIAQVNTPGLVLIPTTSFSGQFFYDYYDPFPSERLLEFKEGAAIFVDGARRYKLGFPPDRTRGAIGYLSKPCSDTYALTVKFFCNYPDGIYLDKPQGDRRNNGDVIQVYNHFEGGSMAFAELECHAPAARIMPGEEQSFGIDMLFFSGKRDEIINRAAGLLFPGRASDLMVACNTFLT